MFQRFMLIGALALPLAFIAAMPAKAQGTDQRVIQLEEQVRQLSGLVEELNFQILQMQDQLRRMQEDNELRFQEMEERRSDNGGTRSTNHATAGSGSGDDEFYDNSQSQAQTQVTTQAPAADAQVLGAPPRSLGSITFDADGSPRIAAPAEPALPGNAADGSQLDGATVAALPSGGDDDDELYRNAYEFILSGDYDTAEAGFRDLIARFPDSEHAADAHFWLGEAVLAQQKPREAAEIFLAASRDYPQARKAPDMLFKLGVSLAAMQQRDVACATFTEVLQRFPQASDALKQRVKQEQATASC